MFSIAEGAARVQESLITGVMEYARLRQEGFEIPGNTRGVALVSEDPGIVVYIAATDIEREEHATGTSLFVVTGQADFYQDRDGNRVLGRICAIDLRSRPGSATVRVRFRGAGSLSVSYSLDAALHPPRMGLWILTHPNRASTHEPEALNDNARRRYTPQSSWAEWLDEQKERKAKKAPVPAAERPLGARVVRFRKKKN